MMKQYILIMLFTLAGLAGMAQTNEPLPSGAVQFSNQLWLNPADSTIWTGDAFDGKFVNLGSWHKVDSLLALKADASDLADFYTQSQIDAFLALKADESALDDFYTKLEVDGLLGGYVPTSRTVNGKPLTGNITLNADDVGSLQSGDNVSELTNDAGYITAGDIPSAPVTSVNGKTGAVTVTASDVGLGNVDNTSDANKPISTATQSALDGKEDAFSKGSIVAGTNVTLSGTLANRLVGSGNITINATNSLTASNGLQISSGNITPVYGTGANTIAQGNDSRINNGQTAFSWGNPAGRFLAINSNDSSPIETIGSGNPVNLSTGAYYLTTPIGTPISNDGVVLSFQRSGGQGIQIYASTTSADGIYFRQGTAPSYGPWYRFASREHVSNNYVSNAQKGASNGVASLDGSGKVPTSQLPTTGMQYKGTWNASTNSPTLSDGTGTDGYFYRVTTAGTQNLGSGNITFSVGDDVIHNGSVWQRAPSGTTSTNLALGTRTSTTMPITNSNGNGVTLPARTSSLAGLMTSADLAILNSALQSESDPSVPSYVKSITNTEKSNWNTAYGWGNWKNSNLQDAGWSYKSNGWSFQIANDWTGFVKGTSGSPSGNSELGLLISDLDDDRYLAISSNGSTISWRNASGGWMDLYHSGNFTPSDYLTTANFTWANLSGKPSTFTPSAHTHNASDINAGTLAISRIPTGTTGSTVALGNHTHTFASITSKPTTLSGYGITDGVPTSRTLTINGTTYSLAANRSWTLGASDVGAEPAFSKNTAFNKNFGTAAGTVAEGNDSRIVNAVPNTRQINGKALSANVTLTAADVSAMPTSWTITAGNGLSGGGNGTANRTLHVVAGDGISVSSTNVAVDGTVARRNAANTFTAANTFSQPVVATQYQGTAVSASSSIPTNAQSLFTATVSSNTTYTLTNMTGNPRHIQVIVTNTSGSDVFITFNGAKLPVNQSNRIEAGYTAIFTFLVNNGSAYGTKTLYQND